MDTVSYLTINGESREIADVTSRNNIADLQTDVASVTTKANATQTEVQNARKGTVSYSTLDARLDAIDNTVASAVQAIGTSTAEVEIAAARVAASDSKTKTDLDTRIDADYNALSTRAGALETELTNARVATSDGKTKASLDARIDTDYTALSDQISDQIEKLGTAVSYIKNLIGSNKQILYPVPCLLKGEQVTFSTKSGNSLTADVTIQLFDKNKQYLGYWGFGPTYGASRTITVPGDKNGICYMMWTSDLSEAVQLERGAASTEFEDYKCWLTEDIISNVDILSNQSEELNDFLINLTKGTYFWQGLMITVSNDNIITINGTANANVRYLLNGTQLIGASSIVTLYSSPYNKNLTYPNNYIDIKIKYISGSSVIDATGDQAKIVFTYRPGIDASEERTSITQFTKNSTLGDGSGEFAASWPLCPYFIDTTKNLSEIIFMAKSGDTFNDLKLQIIVQEHSFTQKYLENNNNFIANDTLAYLNLEENNIKNQLTWLPATVSISTGNIKGYKGATQRLMMKDVAKSKYPIYITTTDENVMWSVFQWNIDNEQYKYSTFKEWSSNNDWIIIPANMYFRVGLRWAATTSTPIQPNERDYVLDKLILQKYEEPSINISTIVARNPDFQDNLSSLTRRSSGGSPTAQLIVAHITDTHSASKQWDNFIEAINILQPDIVLHSGDIVKATAVDDYSYMYSNLPLNIPLLLSLGNHEFYSGISGDLGLSNAQAYEKYLQPLVNKYSLNAGGNNYYYYDESKLNKVRFIILNPYDHDYTDPITSGRANRTWMYYSQEQINWFINILQDANTNNKAIIIVSHEPDTKLDFNNCFSSFTQAYVKSIDHSKFNPVNSDTLLWEGNPICDLIEAFKNGESINKTYTQTPIQETLTVSTNFTNQGSFITWITGHRHGDYLGFLRGYDQLCISQATNCLGIGSKYSSNNFHDLGRYENTKTEDLFNFYVIDIISHTLGLVRFGADTGTYFNKRKACLLDYTIPNELPTRTPVLYEI